jgi:lipoyl(octanoyl) transferase
MSLKPDRCDVHRYVRDLEGMLIAVLAEFGIRSQRIAGLTGVWVGEEKIAAIGVRIARWVTSHGFALNVAPDMTYFDAIVPCGISDHGVTSIERVLGSAPPLEQIANVVAEQFGVRFDRTLDYSESLDPVEPQGQEGHRRPSSSVAKDPDPEHREL